MTSGVAAKCFAREQFRSLDATPFYIFSAALHFIPIEQMKDGAYEAYLSLLEKKPGTP
jgi:hypothetical protein